MKKMKCGQNICRVGVAEQICDSVFDFTLVFRKHVRLFASEELKSFQEISTLGALQC